MANRRKMTMLEGQSMLLELARPVALLLCILSLYAAHNLVPLARTDVSGPGFQIGTFSRTVIQNTAAHSPRRCKLSAKRESGDTTPPRFSSSNTCNHQWANRMKT
jgi:hypothetical protein